MALWAVRSPGSARAAAWFSAFAVSATPLVLLRVVGASDVLPARAWEWIRAPAVVFFLRWVRSSRSMARTCLSYDWSEPAPEDAWIIERVRAEARSTLGYSGSGHAPDLLDSDISPPRRTV